MIILLDFMIFLHHQVMGRTRGSRGLTPQVQDAMTKKPEYNIILASTIPTVPLFGLIFWRENSKIGAEMKKKQFSSLK